MNNEFLRMATKTDEEFKPCDFTVEELENITKEQKRPIKSKKSQKNTDLQKFKANYFDFYDDIKSSSLKKQDW